MHLLAKIVVMNSTTKIQLSATSNSTTTELLTPRPDLRALSGGGVAAILICVIAALLLVGAGVIVAIVFHVRRKRREKEEPVSVPNAMINTDGVSQGADASEGAPTKRSANVTRPISYVYPQHCFSHSIKYESVEFGSYYNVNSDLHSSYMHDSVNYENLMEQHRAQDIYAGLDPYQSPAEHEEQLYSQIQTHAHVVMDISRNKIHFVRQLGSGQFGNVEEGIWEAESGSIPVAMKTLREGCSERDKVRFLQEAVTMAQFRHPNVVVMFGIVIEGEPIILVVELLDKGDLRKNLRIIRNDPGQLTSPDMPQLLLKFSQHVALGMHYLSSKGFVHRDLAARNILLSSNNICKIADFGLSRELESKSYYKSSGGLVPVKWTAPEAIRHRKYSTASDVWSYGCLLYEIWSLGHKPFEKIQNLEVLRTLETGKRLAPPTGCPKAIYQFMTKCWHPSDSHRPSFRDAIIALTEKAVRVLEIPQEALDLSPQFKSLGGPLHLGDKIYMDLQTEYMKEYHPDADAQ